MDVLANGPESAFASYFDIDWHPPSRTLDEKVLLPVLGRPFGEALDSGELELQFDDGKFVIQYFDQRFPLSPKSYAQILNFRIGDLKEPLGEHAPAYQEYIGIVAGFAGLAEKDHTAMRA
jgi:(1->4)-alpha-D-glucan 1-alpha-D-glucosylmutase